MTVFVQNAVELHLIIKLIVMKKLILLVMSMTALMACSSNKKIAAANTTQTTVSASQDGSSFENAVVITEKSETTGVTAEYKWLKEHYPGYKTESQSLNYNNKKPYDIINIILSNGDKKKVYFDISNFFGKF